MVMSLELHVITRPVSVLPPPSFVVAENAGAFEPTSTDCDVGATVTLATGTAVTVSVAPLLVCPSLAAVIVVVPGDAPVATPEPLIVATPVLLEFHVTTRPVSTLPPASFVTAVNAGVFEPSTTDCVVGEIVTVATGTAVTVSVAPLLVCPSLDAVMVVVPGDWPVATPEPLILSLIHISEPTRRTPIS